MTDSSIENELSSYLNSDEKLLWSGKPKTGIVFRSYDIFLIPFSLVWSGSAFQSSHSVRSSFDFFPFILFILVGIYLVIGRFFVDAIKRANTIYGITSKKIIIQTQIFGKETKLLDLKTITKITLSENKNGIGTIKLNPLDSSDYTRPHIRFTGSRSYGLNQPPSLEFIQNVKEVYDLILKLQEKK
jgi:hypothetical protein